jgi:citrate lyase subunit beta/citryl-CoA lyase
VPIVNRIFLPGEREVAWARRVVDGFEASGEGVLAVNGEMIDLPVVERARRILREGSEA